MKQTSSLFLALAFGLASCSGGGSAAPLAVPAAAAPQATAAPATPAPAPTGTTAPGFAPTSLPLNVSAFTATSSVDRTDARPLVLAARSGIGVPQGQAGNVHIFPTQSGLTPAAVARRPKSFLNSPFDMIYHGGIVLGGTVSHNIYVSTNYQNCGTTCWGTPAQFLTDLGSSNFIHNVDQYIGLNSPNRYTKGASFTSTVYLSSSIPSSRNPVIGQGDILFLVYQAAQTVGGGYGHVFHVFLHPNLDTCIDLTVRCYSPDNSSTFSFCAYHGFVEYGPGNHLLYTVEPYQNVPGCRIVGGANAAQNGDDLIDSTATALSHELFETITDPDPHSAWSNLNRDEVADPCSAVWYNTNLSGTYYAIQSEYSDVYQACIGG